jgi:hypothetical protein
VELGLRHALEEFRGFESLAFGLACAGTVDSSRGVVVASPNLPLVEVPVRQGIVPLASSLVARARKSACPTKSSCVRKRCAAGWLGRARTRSLPIWVAHLAGCASGSLATTRVVESRTGMMPTNPSVSLERMRS